EPISLKVPPQEHRWYLIRQGQLLKARKLWNWNRSRPGEHRGVCAGYTDAARVRMLQVVAAIDWKAAGEILFVTLTYPDCVANATYRERTTQRSLMQRYIEKYAGRDRKSVV